VTNVSASQEAASRPEIALNADGAVAIRWPDTDNLWHIGQYGRAALAGHYTRLTLDEKDWTPVTAPLQPVPKPSRASDTLVATLTGTRPMLAGLMPLDVLEALHNRLTHWFDDPTAMGLLHEVERTVSSWRSIEPREVTRLREDNATRIQKLRRELASTIGLRWKSWTRGFYVVTYDGNPAGTVEPAPVWPVPARIRRWQPTAAYVDIGLPRPATRTVKGAAEIVGAAYVDRMTREAAEHRRQQETATPGRAGL
jgi:hypothetical protein